MKRVNNIYNKICDIDVIMDMYDKVIKTNTKNKKKIQNFENFYSCNIAQIKDYLKEFKLTLNSKTKIYSSIEGIEFLGFVFYNKGSKIYMKLTNKTKKKFKEKMKIKNLEYINNFISKKKYLEVRNSYRGHLSYGNCYSLYTKYVLNI